MGWRFDLMLDLDIKEYKLLASPSKDHDIGIGLGRSSAWLAKECGLLFEQQNYTPTLQEMQSC
jgi:hypothetical protein